MQRQTYKQRKKKEERKELIGMIGITVGGIALMILALYIIGTVYGG